MITTSALAAPKYLKEEEALKHAEKELAFPFAEEGHNIGLTVIRNLDVNGDQRPDLMVLHPIASCGTRGCTPLFFLNTPQGYCYSESEHIVLDEKQKIVSKMKIDKNMKCK